MLRVIHGVDGAAARFDADRFELDDGALVLLDAADAPLAVFAAGAWGAVICE